ncbi:MAG: hypothetical protein H7245_01245 [Candidatus Saccharibacteria bacterium]|nr:hypothetical protein [Pseudorhodobacter sp.]
MKTLIIAAILASAILSLSAPLQSATQTPALSLEQQMDGSLARRGFDTRRDIREHPRCTKD